ncbi:MAG: hypothetical protein M5U09_19220 [Gammaproteobacteria bacterium]|nr:hypothetical protein [Gammaproteobacteria bacterium]
MDDPALAAEIDRHKVERADGVAERFTLDRPPAFHKGPQPRRQPAFGDRGRRAGQRVHRHITHHVVALGDVVPRRPRRTARHGAFAAVQRDRGNHRAGNAGQYRQR